ncbi:MAG: GIY-YIG nuclease family protein [Candidatus Zapsychrus exili]|nr:GIY-YIG nuclease family protein [Candidatus Zapsychrus exili]
MCCTYILISKDRLHTYVGSTSNMDRRFKEHNLGKVVYSKKFVPYDILYMEEFDNIVEARRREEYYKSTSGRRKIKHIISIKK